MYCVVSIRLVLGQKWTVGYHQVDAGAVVDCDLSIRLVLRQKCTVAYK